MKENWEVHWKDYFKILQIHPLAEPRVVVAAYRKLLGKYHPDHNPSNKQEWAIQKTKELNEAFEVIGNLGKRRQYSETYNQKVCPKSALPSPSKSPLQPKPRARPTNRHWTSQEIETLEQMKKRYPNRGKKDRRNPRRRFPWF